MPTTSLNTCLQIVEAYASLTRRFDRRLSAHGISLSDFVLLRHIAQAPEGKIRRIDLADQLSMTASGVTRALGPLERIGLVDRQRDARDARVAFATLTKTGSKILSDALVSANDVAEDVTADLSPRELKATDAGLLKLAVPS